MFGVGIDVGDGTGVGVADGCAVGDGVADGVDTIGLAAGCGRSGGLPLSFEKIKYASVPIETRATMIEATVIGKRKELRFFVDPDGGKAPADIGADTRIVSA